MTKDLNKEGDEGAIDATEEKNAVVSDSTEGEDISAKEAENRKKKGDDVALEFILSDRFRDSQL